MIKLGLTGPMGSGKTYCSKLFEKLGVPIFNSDDVAKKIINTNLQLRSEIIKEFGNVYDDDGMMIPGLIRSIVFTDGGEERLNILTKLTGVHVMNEYENFCELHKDKKYTIAESAILYECGMNKHVDKVIYVCVDEETRIERTFKRSGFSREEYHNRMKNQILPQIKIKMCDFIIDNNDGVKVEKRVKEIHKTLLY